MNTLSLHDKFWWYKCSKAGMHWEKGWSASPTCSLSSMAGTSPQRYGGTGLDSCLFALGTARRFPKLVPPGGKHKPTDRSH